MKKIVIIILSITLFITACSSDTKNSAKMTSCKEPFLDTSNSYTVEFTTTKGTFSIALDAKNYPVSSAHLAALVKSGFYDGLTFHRVVPDFVIQGGDPNGDGTGSSKCKVISEEPKRNYKQGDFAWAKAADDPAGTAGSQFFIVTGKADSRNVQFLNSKSPDVDGTERLSYGYAGYVSEGLDTVLAIEALATEGSDGPPSEVVTITKAKLKS